MKIFTSKIEISYLTEDSFQSFVNKVRKHCRECEICYDNIKWFQTQSSDWVIMTAIV